MRAITMVVLVLTASVAWADGEAGYAGPATRPKIPAPEVVIPPTMRTAPSGGATAAVAPAAPAEVISLPAHGDGFGADTRYWTTLQVSGASASKVARPIPGEVAQRSYERYLRSFTYPIPEKFDRDSFVGGGGGGGSGGGTGSSGSSN